MTQQNAVATTKTEPTPAVIKKTPVPIGDRGIVISDLDSLWRFSGYVAASGLAPRGIEKQESIFIAIQMGLEIGMTPMASLQNIAVINGRPSIWGDSMLALVRASGLMEAYDETETNDEIDPLFRELCFTDDPAARKTLKIKIAQMQSKVKRDTDDFGVTCYTRRQNYNETFSRFTVLDAKKAALWGKSGPWTQYPGRMLKFRSRSFLLRDVYGDVLKGLHSAEETQDLPAKVEVASAVASLPSFEIPREMKTITDSPNPVADSTVTTGPITTTPSPQPVVMQDPDPAPAPVAPRVWLQGFMDEAKVPLDDFTGWLVTIGLATKESMAGVDSWDKVPEQIAADFQAKPQGLKKCVTLYGGGAK